MCIPSGKNPRGRPEKSSMLNKIMIKNRYFGTIEDRPENALAGDFFYEYSNHETTKENLLCIYVFSGTEWLTIKLDKDVVDPAEKIRMAIQKNQYYIKSAVIADSGTRGKKNAKNHD